MLAACSSARIKPEYDVRRQSVSIVRVNRRTATRSAAPPPRSTGPGSCRDCSCTSAPASCHSASAAVASKSVGTGTRSGTSDSPAVRPKSSRLSPEWAAFWLGPHQVTTCDWARVSAT